MGLMGAKLAPGGRLTAPDGRIEGTQYRHLMRAKWTYWVPNGRLRGPYSASGGRLMGSRWAPAGCIEGPHLAPDGCLMDLMGT